MKRIMLAVVLVVGSTATPGSLGATFMTGNMLLEKCKVGEGTDWGGFQAGECGGYIEGIADAHNTFANTADMPPLWCDPPNVTFGQVIRVTLKFLDQHPEDLDQAASSLVSTAFQQAFSCTPSNTEVQQD